MAGRLQYDQGMINRLNGTAGMGTEDDSFVLHSVAGFESNALPNAAMRQIGG